MTNSANYRLPGVGTPTRAESAADPDAAGGQLPVSGPPDDETCECGHPRARHDAVAARYCAATVTGAMERGCICAASAAAP